MEKPAAKKIKAIETNGWKREYVCTPNIIAVITKNRHIVANFFRRIRSGASFPGKSAEAGSVGDKDSSRFSIFGWIEK